jgi:hypothetical protein
MHVHPACRSIPFGMRAGLQPGRCLRGRPERKLIIGVTSGFQKMNGQWMVAHDHVSLPFEGDG